MIYLIIFTLISPIVYGANSSSLNFCDSFFKVYVSGCDNRASSNVAGGSFPLLFDAFNLSPANIPTYLTPAGIEYFKGEAESNFALIKGLKQFGLGGLSRATKNTFMSEVENYEIALKNRVNNYTSTMTDSFKNIGFAFNLLNIPNTITLPFGASYKFNPDKNVASAVLGLSLRTPIINMSYSFNQESPDPFQDNNNSTVKEKITIQKMSAGLKYRTLMADYVLMIQDHETIYENSGSSSYYNTTGSYQVKTHIFSATWQWGDANFTYASRSQSDSRFIGNESYLETINYKKRHDMYGMRYSLGKYLNLGVYHNYIIEEDFSFLAQLLL